MQAMDVNRETPYDSPGLFSALLPVWLLPRYRRFYADGQVGAKGWCTEAGGSEAG